MNKKYENNIRRLAKQHNINEEELIKFYEYSKDTSLADLTPIKRGQVGELYVKYYLARHGIQFAEPSLLEEALDVLIVGKSGKVYRCEIKSSSSYIVKINRCHYSKGKFENHRYNGSEVDFFILCTLNNENVFIVPFSEYNHIGQEVACSPVSQYWKYKDRIDLFK